MKNPIKGANTDDLMIVLEASFFGQLMLVEVTIMVLTARIT